MWYWGNLCQDNIIIGSVVRRAHENWVNLCTDNMCFRLTCHGEHMNIGTTCARTTWASGSLVTRVTWTLGLVVARYSWAGASKGSIVLRVVFDDPSQKRPNCLLWSLDIMFLVWKGPVLNDPSISIWPVKMFLVKQSCWECSLLCRKNGNALIPI